MFFLSVFSQIVFSQSVFPRSVFYQRKFFQSVSIQSVFLQNVPNWRVLQAFQVYFTQPSLITNHTIAMWLNTTQANEWKSCNILPRSRVCLYFGIFFFGWPYQKHLDFEEEKKRFYPFILLSLAGLLPVHMARQFPWFSSDRIGSTLDLAVSQSWSEIVCRVQIGQQAFNQCTIHCAKSNAVTDCWSPEICRMQVGHWSAEPGTIQVSSSSFLWSVSAKLLQVSWYVTT